MIGPRITQLVTRFLTLTVADKELALFLTEIAVNPLLLQNRLADFLRRMSLAGRV